MKVEYEIDQILYLVMKDKPSVIPVKICEHIMRKTSSGIENQYMIELPGNENKVCSLSSIRSDVFSSPESAAEFMYQKAKSRIDEMIEVCEKMVKEHFENQDNLILETESENVQMVDFGDGVVGRIKS